MDISENIFHSRSKRTAFQQPGKFIVLLRHWSWCMRWVLLVFPVANQNRGFSHTETISTLLISEGKRECLCLVESLCHNSSQAPPRKLDILKVRYLIPTCAHLLCAYIWEHCSPHLQNSLFAGSYWNFR